MLKAFKVQVVDLKNNTKEDFFFPSYKWATFNASKKADKVEIGYTIMYENVGKEEYVEIQRFEKDYTVKNISEEKEVKVNRDDCAIGNTHEKRWNNAMKNEKVPIIIKKRSKEKNINC